MSINQTTYQIACIKEIDDDDGYMYWWHQKIDKKFLIKACQTD